jgi:hypothetical protein
MSSKPIVASLETVCADHAESNLNRRQRADSNANPGTWFTGRNHIGTIDDNNKARTICR